MSAPKCHKRRFAGISLAVLEAFRAECRGEPCTVYRCPDCGGFHLTSKSPKRRGGVFNQARLIDRSRR